VEEEVLEAMRPYFSQKYGNAASLHSWGQEARLALEDSRLCVATFLGARPEEIVFTSGGTESDNLALVGVAMALRARGNHIITSAIEHHAVTETCAYLAGQGFQVTYVPVDAYGQVDPDEVAKAIRRETILISIMHANNEIGTIQPLAEIGHLARSREIYFHTDAVQTLGHVPFQVDEIGCDLLSASAHKVYGPKGVGFLYLRRGVKIHPLLHGGDQEKKKRPSTQNIPGIVGFARALKIADSRMKEESGELTELRNFFIDGLLARLAPCRLNGHPEKRLPNNINVSIEYVEGESLLMSLDMMGVACSTGSACSSASLLPSHVLVAIGCPQELAHGSLRFSLGRSTTREDLAYVLEVLPPVVNRLRKMSPLYVKEKG
jgi:cysteine desulfurase